MSKTILLTGAAGFIGFHVAKSLLERGDLVIGIDNLNNYYDVKLKQDRLALLKKFNNFTFIQQSIEDSINVKEKIDVICHLAAQAGVRYSLDKPFEYEKSNMLGTLNIFEFARHNKINKIVFASSSSVYGDSKDSPFKETQKLDEPISLYAATKKANELYAHVYNHLFKIKMIGLRFFTVYGPWGRPDMAPIKFAKGISQGEQIEVYNNGKMSRDFTYVQDIATGVISSIDKVESVEFEIINLARGESVNLLDFISEIEKNMGKQAVKKYIPLQQGDVLATSADISKAKNLLGYNPKTSVSEGVKNFVSWYKEYYKVN
ncbi:MAG TPA: NAD-dependent epimerase/dehydratase family protein [Candidatus Nanoarchaeia archaeon]|nr:NAD-dependent epimerase/dehydratase family protein [Candidatus Nanoarchaeia archaeon]